MGTLALDTPPVRIWRHCIFRSQCDAGVSKSNRIRKRVEQNGHGKNNNALFDFDVQNLS
jgi:hypothetical protein